LKNRFLSKKNLNPNILATTAAGIWANQIMRRVIFFQKTIRVDDANKQKLKVPLCGQARAGPHMGPNKMNRVG
jgi:hypothetical protein